MIEADTMIISDQPDMSPQELAQDIVVQSTDIECVEEVKDKEEMCNQKVNDLNENLEGLGSKPSHASPGRQADFQPKYQTEEAEKLLKLADHKADNEPEKETTFSAKIIDDSVEILESDMDSSIDSVEVFDSHTAVQGLGGLNVETSSRVNTTNYYPQLDREVLPVTESPPVVQDGDKSTLSQGNHQKDETLKTPVYHPHQESLENKVTACKPTADNTTNNEEDITKKVQSDDLLKSPTNLDRAYKPDVEPSARLEALLSRESAPTKKEPLNLDKQIQEKQEQPNVPDLRESGGKGSRVSSDVSTSDKVRDVTKVAASQEGDVVAQPRKPGISAKPVPKPRNFFLRKPSLNAPPGV